MQSSFAKVELMRCLFTHRLTGWPDNGILNNAIERRQPVACRVVRISTAKILFPSGLDGFAVKPHALIPATAAGDSSDMRYTFDDNVVGIQPVAVIGPDRDSILDYMRLRETSRIRIGPTLETDPPFTIHYEWQAFSKSRNAIKIYSARGAVAQYAANSIKGFVAEGLDDLHQKVLELSEAAKTLWNRTGVDDKAECGLVAYYLPMDSSTDTGERSITFPELANLAE
jgi:hypothetical protein